MSATSALPPPIILAAPGNHAVVGTSADIYSFGILMFEVATGEDVYPTRMTHMDIVQAVYQNNLRPTFPRNMPAEYTALAER